jgi:hypothetical protein
MKHNISIKNSLNKQERMEGCMGIGKSIWFRPLGWIKHFISRWDLLCLDIVYGTVFVENRGSCFTYKEGEMIQQRPCYWYHAGIAGYTDGPNYRQRSHADIGTI